MGRRNARPPVRRPLRTGTRRGHTPQEYTATGIQLDRAKRRKRRLAESVEIIRRLVDGETVDHAGDHDRVEGARIDPARQDRLPILIGGNGAELLGHAGAHADIVGLQSPGGTRVDRHRHMVKWDPAWLDVQIDQIRAGYVTRDLDTFAPIIEAVRGQPGDV